MTRPLVILVIAFCLGIIFARFLNIYFSALYIFAVALLCLVIFLPQARYIPSIIICLFVFILGALFLRQSQILPRCHISRLIYFEKGMFYTVKGIIESQPEVENDETTFVLALNQIYDSKANFKCCGKLLARLEGRKEFYYGQGLTLTGNISQLPNFKNEFGISSYRDYLHSQGVYGIMRPMLVENGSGPANIGYGLIGLTLNLKQKIEKMIFKYTSSLTAAVLDAMILGEKKYIPPLLYQSMINTGTVHILVVSGFNVGIVAFIAMLFLKIIRLPRSLRYFSSIFVVIIYCLMTGASNPVVRATVMALTFIIANIIDREADIYNSCCLAALFILVCSPNQLFDIGFQLSFISVISIIYIYPKLSRLFRAEAIRIRLIRMIADGFLVSFSAWLGTGGFIFYYFRIICPVTVLANIIIVPLATLITLCGIVFIAISSICPALAPVFVPACEVTVAILLKTNAIFASVPPLM